MVLSAGQDARKNHSIGVLRSETDVFPFRNTPWFDLREAYVSARIPIGEGPVIKVGKFVLNCSRGYLFTLATPVNRETPLASSDHR